MEGKQKLVEVLQNIPGSVGYVPMSDEPDYTEFLKENKIALPSLFVPATKDVDPSKLAAEFTLQYPKGAAIFVPGRGFDTSGTRHGRGAGWYDRFLAEVPSEWVRIGVLRPELLHEKLQRESWDQPVHFLLIETHDGYEAYQTGEVL